MVCGHTDWEGHILLLDDSVSQPVGRDPNLGITAVLSGSRSSSWLYILITHNILLSVLNTVFIVNVITCSDVAMSA